MTQPKPTVKSKRSYDSSRRQEQAQRNRDRILDASERRFLRDGYATTTVATIAVDAGVSADTIYKAFGGKPGLVRAIRTRALAGEGSTPAEQRSDALHEHETDPRKIIEAWGKFTTEIMPRVAPILLLIHAAAATDPEVGLLAEEMDADRLHRMTLNARRLHDGGHLRDGMTIARASDVLWTYSAPELYELLVLRRGWSRKRYGGFVADALINALL
jgi:Bacterial regulatory proteins, tetR family.